MYSSDSYAALEAKNLEVERMERESKILRRSIDELDEERCNLETEIGAESKRLVKALEMQKILEKKLQKTKEDAEKEVHALADTF